MRRKLTIALCIMAAFAALSCSKVGGDGEEPKMEMELVDVTASGCSVNVRLSGGATAYRMKVIPLDSFDSKAVAEELSSGSGHTAESRKVERLHGARDFVIAARPYNSLGVLGKMVSEQFTLEDFDLEMTLYTPGDSLGVQLNRYNTLNVMATSNGLAAGGRCALAVTTVWAPLCDAKGLEAAAEEVFSSNCIVLTRQQLEEMSDPNPLKRDVMYFTDLSDGTQYTLVVCLEDFDGESYYYSFNGATKRLNP